MENNCTICVHRGAGQENVERCMLVNVPMHFLHFKILTKLNNYVIL